VVVVVMTFVGLFLLAVSMNESIDPRSRLSRVGARSSRGRFIPQSRGSPARVPLSPMLSARHGHLPPGGPSDAGDPARPPSGLRCGEPGKPSVTASLLELDQVSLGLPQSTIATNIQILKAQT
jgi:hypothetical protein